ncbi:MAG: tetratricopeptide repeat protein [Dongiaceae bacterium]
MTIRKSSATWPVAISILFALLAVSPQAEAQTQAAVNAATQHWKQGLAYRDQKQYAQAIAEFKQSIATYPTSAAYNDMGYAYQESGQFDAAMSAYQKAIELKPNNGAAYQNLGALYYLQYKDYAKAEASFREALRLGSNSENSNMGLGLALESQGRYGDALMPFANAAQANPANPKPLLHLGNAFARMGQVKEARQVLGKLQTINQADARQLEQIIVQVSTPAPATAAPAAKADPAAALIQEGDNLAAQAAKEYAAKNYAAGNETVRKAYKAYDEAIKLNPKSYEAHRKLGDLYAKRYFGSSQTEPAIASYKKALELKPDSGYVNSQLSLCYLKLDRYPEAIASAKRAIQLEPGSAMGVYNLGFIYAAMGHYDEARKIQSQLLGKDKKLAQQLQDAINESSRLSSNIVRPKTFANPRIELVAVKPGNFMMGAGKTAKGRQVTIARTYYIGNFPVTQAQWQMVMGDNPSSLKNCGACPVDTVSWNDAQAFITRINSLNDGYRYRLPSEAEWEFAYRAGGAANAWPSGETGWNSVNSGGKTQPVGQKPANALGIHDMAGLIEEWCMDYFVADLAASPADGSPWLNPEVRRYRSLRGTSYQVLATDVVTRRSGLVPQNSTMHTGFRVAAVRAGTG